MKVRIKKLNEKAVMPFYAKEGDACMDLTATSMTRLDDDVIEYGTGLAFEVPEGHVMLLFPRSSVTNKSLMLKNSVGVVDSGYRGEVKLRFDSWDAYSETEDGKRVYEVGERIGQFMIIPRPHMEIELAEELTDTERGEGGYGSTGK